MTTNTKFYSAEKKEMMTNEIANFKISRKRDLPKQLSWKEIKERYQHIIEQSKVLHGNINYEI